MLSLLKDIFVTAGAICTGALILYCVVWVAQFLRALIWYGR
jgi:hypothetical protein